MVFFSLWTRVFHILDTYMISSVIVAVMVCLLSSKRNLSSSDLFVSNMMYLIKFHYTYFSNIPNNVLLIYLVGWLTFNMCRESNMSVFLIFDFFFCHKITAFIFQWANVSYFVSCKRIYNFFVRFVFVGNFFHFIGNIIRSFKYAVT